MNLITIAYTYANSFGDIFLSGESFLVESQEDVTKATQSIVEKLIALKCTPLKQVTVWPSDEMMTKLVGSHMAPPVDDLRVIVALRDAELIQAAIQNKFGFEASLEYCASLVAFHDEIDGKLGQLDQQVEEKTDAHA